METGLLIMLIVIGNLVLYWLFVGKKKFDNKFGVRLDGRENTRR